MAKNFQKKLSDYETQFSLASEEYVETYAQAKQYPNVVRHLTPFRNAEQAITDANAGLFSLEGEVRSEVRKLASQLKQTDTKIDELKETNDRLNQEASDIKGADKGAEGRSTNARQTSYMAMYSSAALLVVGYFAYKTVRRG
jgi:FtsZ-binding cell division protein ZapB